jgi:hypothetical protein
MVRAPTAARLFLHVVFATRRQECLRYVSHEFRQTEGILRHQFRHT